MEDVVRRFSRTLNAIRQVYGKKVYFDTQAFMTLDGEVTVGFRVICSHQVEPLTEPVKMVDLDKRELLEIDPVVFFGAQAPSGYF